MGWPCELLGLKAGAETLVAPRPMVVNESVTSMPEPVTPPVPGRRFNVISASPASFWIFLVKVTCWPSLAIRLPCTTSLSFSTLGSYLICKGAENRSVAFVITRFTLNGPPIMVSTWPGTKLTSALFDAAGGAAGGPAGAGVVAAGPAGVPGAIGIGLFGSPSADACGA